MHRTSMSLRTSTWSGRDISKHAVAVVEASLDRTAGALMLRFCAVDVAVSEMLPAVALVELPLPLPAPRLDPVAASPPAADVVALVLSNLSVPALPPLPEPLPDAWVFIFHFHDHLGLIGFLTLTRTQMLPPWHSWWWRLRHCHLQAQHAGRCHHPSQVLLQHESQQCLPSNAKQTTLTDTSDGTWGASCKLSLIINQAI